jgi:enamine deaminase RidA (YjgF/YER057c/UK114 family)
MTITHLNPPTMHSNPAFSQGVRVDGAGALVVVGGQNGVDGTGAVVSAELGLQSAQALRNVLAVLEAAGATQDDVIKLTVYIVEGGDIREGFAAAQEVWGPHPTAISVLLVAGLARPDCLVEVEALAFLSAKG